MKLFVTYPQTFLNGYDVFVVSERLEAKFYGWLKERPHMTARLVNEYEAGEILEEHSNGVGIGCYVPAPRHDINANYCRRGIAQVRMDAFITRILKAPRNLCLSPVALIKGPDPIKPKPAPRPLLRLKA